MTGVYKELVHHLNQRGGEQKEQMHKVVVSHYISMIASAMHVKVKIAGSPPMPCNHYGLVIAPSGAGKNYTVDLVEDMLLKPFKLSFNQLLAQRHTELVASKVEELAELGIVKEDKLGEEAYKLTPKPSIIDFPNDSATSAGIRAVREASQVFGMSTLSLSVDEIGTALKDSGDALKEFLSMYGSGQLKTKIIKGSVDNTRTGSNGEPVPANLLMFGTGSKLLDGNTTERMFREWLSTGYARRLFFANLGDIEPVKEKRPEDIYNALMLIEDSFHVSKSVSDLASPCLVGTTIELTKDVNIALLKYKQDCELKASEFPVSKEDEAIELSSRFYKVIKFAGALAFVEGKKEVTMDILNQAIDLGESSGKDFNKLLSIKHNHERLVEYITSSKEPVTIPDMLRDLPFMPTTQTKIRDLIRLASDWGYSNCSPITVELRGVTEVYSGKSLEPATEGFVTLSYSKGNAHDYKPEKLAWERLIKLVGLGGYNFCNTAFIDNHRKEDNVTGVSDMLVFDIDKGCALNDAKIMLEGFKSIIYTTKRHTPEENRFRVILPLTHSIPYKGNEFKRLMLNTIRWLPFNDVSTTQRSRKWATNLGAEVHVSEGVSLDTSMLIPKTLIVQEREERILKGGQDLGNLERWFSMGAMSLGRNNTLYRYCRVLMNRGESNDNVKKKIKELNKTFQEPLKESELKTSIFKQLDNNQ